MNVIVNISVTLSELWGIEELIADCEDVGYTEEQTHTAIIDLVQEDISYLLEDAKFTVQINR